MTTADSSSPPWQVLELTARRLDPQTLATAACVSKSWSASMSSDHLWKPLCSTTYPSLSSLHSSSAISYRKLFSLGRAADDRRLRKAPKPQLSMRDLIFSIDIRVATDDGSCSRVATVVKPGALMKSEDIFRFDIDVGGGDEEQVAAFEVVNRLRVSWNVVLEGLKGVFTMMECEGKEKGMSFVVGFSKELPLSGCCLSGGGSGMVADMRLGTRDEKGRMVVEKVSVGMLSVLTWRYVCVEDALRYLQFFLLPATC